MGTDISWTDEVWNPVTGCTKCAPGCKNCYAMAMTKRLQAMGKAKYRNGFKVTCHPDSLNEPLRWRKPKRIFVNSMSDLFHEDVPFKFIDEVQMVKLVCPHHTFQTLTKRPERMAEYFAGEWYHRVINLPWFEKVNERRLRTANDAMQSAMGRSFGGITCGPHESRVLPNDWLGYSASTQADLDRGVPKLLKIPAAVRFLSLEPMLEAMDVTPYFQCPRCCDFGKTWDGITDHDCTVCAGVSSDRGNVDGGLDWVIAGGESGNGRRPFRVEWAEAVYGQCQDVGIPFWMKQDSHRFPGQQGRIPDALWNVKELPA